jgi:hypothetical protein
VIRRLLVLAGLATAAWWVLRGRGRGREPRAVVGYGDGSSLTLEVGSPALERMLELARRTVRP